MLRIIGGKFKSRLLKTPKTITTRPTQSVVRAAVFNICQNQIEGAAFLDLFAGSGAMGLEALSRGAKSATFLENNRQALRCIQENIASLQVESQSRIISTPFSKAIETLTNSFDIIFADPPYDFSFNPDIALNLLKEGGLLFIEEQYIPNLELKPHPHLLDRRRFGIANLLIFKK